jgi:RNA polymerase sigma-70 factor (ECF subfamily)
MFPAPRRVLINAPPVASDPHLFHTTHWSIIRKAADHGSPESLHALETLCRAYWYPLYSYVRSTGIRHEDACDLTQDFFSRLLSNDRTLGSLAPENGRFRSFLLVAIRRLIASSWRRSYSQKRGGGTPAIVIDEADALARFDAGHHDGNSPEVVFDRNWAASVMDRALARLASHWHEKDKPLDQLRTYLTDARGTVPVADMAAQLGVSTASLKASIYRLRKLFADLLRDELAATVSDPSEIDSELRYLLTVLAEAG